MFRNFFKDSEKIAGINNAKLSHLSPKLRKSINKSISDFEKILIALISKEDFVLIATEQKIIVFNYQGSRRAKVLEYSQIRKIQKKYVGNGESAIKIHLTDQIIHIERLPSLTEFYIEVVQVKRRMKFDHTFDDEPKVTSENKVAGQLKSDKSDSMSDLNGYVYILINASLQQDMLKIGMTTRNPQARAKEISTGTGIPTEYIVAYEHAVSDCRAAERSIHDALDDYRVNSKREFFNIPLNEAVKRVGKIAAKYS